MSILEYVSYAVRYFAFGLIRISANLSRIRGTWTKTATGSRWSPTSLDDGAVLVCWTARGCATLDLETRTVETSDSIALSLGLFDLAVVRLTGATATRVRSVDIHLAPAGARAEAVVMPNTIVSRSLSLAMLSLSRQIARPLSIVRDLVADLSGLGSISLRDGARFPRDTAGHLGHLLDLAALVEAQSIPVQINPQRPLISLVVPVYNTRVSYLDDLLRSFELQPAGLAELVLSDDCSTSWATRDWLNRVTKRPNVKVIYSDQNAGIARTTNAGITYARGDWVGLVDHDDALTPFALSCVARVLLARPDCTFLYTDEVIGDEMLRSIGFFHKPAFDIVLLSGVNYINHLSVYRRDRLIQIGMLSLDYDGSQDYDLVLRYTAGLDENTFLHLPYPAYIWRRSASTYSIRHLERATLNARRALSSRFARSGEEPQVEGALDPNLHRVRFDRGNTIWPKVSVIIPSIDAPNLIRRLLEGLIAETDYQLMEILVVDNGTTDRRTLAIYADYQRRDERICVVVEPAPFNFSASVNKGLARTNGDIVLLLNNDIEILEPNWLKEMVSVFRYGDVGIVGAKLLYPDRKIQHAGVIVGFGDLAGHWFIGQDEMHPGGMGRLWVRQSLSAVTGACFAISRACLSAVGGFDEEEFAIAYNDIDYCLRAGAAGFRVVWTPFATLIHHESATRGSDEAPDKIARFRREQANLKRRYATDQFRDPALNPWLSRAYSDPSPIGLSNLPEARSWGRPVRRDNY